MVVSDPQSDSDAEAGDVEFGEENQIPPVQVISAEQVEVPVQSLLKGSWSFLKDSLLSFDELLENIRECLQSQWSSKFVPTVRQVHIEQYPEDFKRFQECVIIHTDHLPNVTQGAVSLLSLVPLVPPFCRPQLRFVAVVLCDFVFASGYKLIFCRPEAARGFVWEALPCSWGSANMQCQACKNT